jgi:hypothetical protein
MNSARWGSSSHLAALAVLFYLAIAAAVQAQPVLYGSTCGSSPDAGLVGILNQTTAAFTLLGDPTDDGPLPAIAINSAGQMFGSNNSVGSGSPGTLIRIDTATGLRLATVGNIVDSADAEAITVTDLDFQPGTDKLFGIAGKGSKEGFLYTIDTATAAATFVGATGLQRGGLAFAPDGTLYVATVGLGSPPVIARVNPANAAVIGSPVTLLEDGIEGLAVRPSDGVIFGTSDDAEELWTINATTGEMTLIGLDDAPVCNAADLAFSPGRGPAKAPALSETGIAALLLALLATGWALARRSVVSLPR